MSPSMGEQSGTTKGDARRTVKCRILLDALKESHTKVDVELKNSKRTRAWFGAEHNMHAISEVYRYIMDLK